MALNSQQQSQLAQVLQSKGYNATDAQNAAANSGGRADDLYREYISGGSGGTGGSGGNVDNAMAELRKAIEVSTGALRGQQELLPKQTELRKTELVKQQSNLEARYASLLDEVKGQTAQAVNRTTATTNQELARRGINLQGNLAQQEVNAAVNPLNIEGGRQITNIGLGREADLATITNAINKLPLEEQQMYLQLQQAIGAAQASGNTTALNAAIQQAAQAQAAAEAQRTYELQVAQQEMLKEKNIADIKNIESQIADRARTKAATITQGSQAEIDAIAEALGQPKGTNMSTIPSYFTPVNTSTPYTLYSK